MRRRRAPSRPGNGPPRCRSSIAARALICSTRSDDCWRNSRRICFCRSALPEVCRLRWSRSIGEPSAAPRSLLNGLCGALTQRHSRLLRGRDPSRRILCALCRTPRKRTGRHSANFLKLGSRILKRWLTGILKASLSGRPTPSTRRRAADCGAARFGQPADQPIGLDRVPEPGLGPARLDAGFYGFPVDLAARLVEHRELAASLSECRGKGTGAVQRWDEKTRFRGADPGGVRPPLSQQPEGART